MTFLQQLGLSILYSNYFHLHTNLSWFLYKKLWMFFFPFVFMNIWFYFDFENIPKLSKSELFKHWSWVIGPRYIVNIEYWVRALSIFRYSMSSTYQGIFQSWFFGAGSLSSTQPDSIRHLKNTCLSCQDLNIFMGRGIKFFNSHEYVRVYLNGLIPYYTSVFLLWPGTLLNLTFVNHEAKGISLIMYHIGNVKPLYLSYSSKFLWIKTFFIL